MSSQPLLVEYAPVRSVAQAIFDTIDTGLLVLDRNLRVSSASAAFCRMFDVQMEDIRGRLFYELGGGHWDTPDIRLTLDAVASGSGSLHACEVEYEFLEVGPRTMLLDARQIPDSDDAGASILLTVTDVTDARAAERRLTVLLDHKTTLLEEMTHRVANSLTIIAGILILKARRVHDVEARLFLEETHHRVMSIATAQRLLRTSLNDAEVALGPYLTELCESLATSMIGDGQKIEMRVQAGDGTARSRDAVSIGLIVTELVINALKHAFSPDATHGRVTVTYEAIPAGWTLSVADNGIGETQRAERIAKPGLGSVIIEALARQLEARVEIQIKHNGRTTTITHAVH
jgi:two-component sensor histidine kinase